MGMGGGTLVSIKGAFRSSGDVVGVGVPLPPDPLWREYGVPEERDPLEGERDLGGDEVGVPGDRGGVEVGVWGGRCCLGGEVPRGESEIGDPGVALAVSPGDPWVEVLRLKLRLGGSTLTPGAALCPTSASNLKFISAGSGKTMSGRVGLADRWSWVDGAGVALV